MTSRRLRWTEFAEVTLLSRPASGCECSKSFVTQKIYELLRHNLEKWWRKHLHKHVHSCRRDAVTSQRVAVALASRATRRWRLLFAVASWRHSFPRRTRWLLAQLSSARRTHRARNRWRRTGARDRRHPCVTSRTTAQFCCSWRELGALLPWRCSVPLVTVRSRPGWAQPSSTRLWRQSSRSSREWRQRLPRAAVRAPVEACFEFARCLCEGSRVFVVLTLLCFGGKLQISQPKIPKIPWVPVG